MEPVDVVKACYAAFGRGDVPAILGLLSKDVSWIDPGSPAIPYAGVRKGSSEAEDFFRELNEHMEFLAFEPKLFLASGADVAVFGSYSARSRKTSRVASTDWAMYWRVENGLVTKYQGHLDTAAVAAALA